MLIDVSQVKPCYLFSMPTPVVCSIVMLTMPDFLERK